MPELRLRQPGGGNRARGIPSRAFPARSVRASVAILLLSLHISGCFHYVPVTQAALPSGKEILVGITDRGRVELSPVFGPGIRRVRGDVLESTDTSLVLAVTSVQYLDTDMPAPWDGSRIEIARDFIADIREQRLSRPRTLIMVGLVAVTAVAASMIALSGFGGDPGSDRPGNGGGDQQ